MSKYKTITILVVILFVAGAIFVGLYNRRFVADNKDIVNIVQKEPITEEQKATERYYKEIDRLQQIADFIKNLPPTYFVGKYKSTDCDLFYGGNLSFTVDKNDESLKSINDGAGLEGDLRLSNLSFNIGGPKIKDETIDQKFGVILPQHDASHCATAEVEARVKLGNMGLNIKEGPSTAQLLEAKALSAPIYKVTEKVPSP